MPSIQRIGGRESGRLMSRSVCALGISRSPHCWHYADSWRSLEDGISSVFPWASGHQWLHKWRGDHHWSESAQVHVGLRHSEVAVRAYDTLQHLQADTRSEVHAFDSRSCVAFALDAQQANGQKVQETQAHGPTWSPDKLCGGHCFASRGAEASRGVFGQVRGRNSKRTNALQSHQIEAWRRGPCLLHRAVILPHWLHGVHCHWKESCCKAWL
mmetsp:Transcript_133535/g.266424  ORF Transcript_133535/g.266424 Transcript_133535/m.266424 type:complete len:213 (-) Transcript_133535:140-778(-)